MDIITGPSYRALIARSPGSATPTQRFAGHTAVGEETLEPALPQTDVTTATPSHPFSPPFEDPPMSVARESLRDLFAHALRDPGDTPVKNGRRPRRNSVGSSSVDESPMQARARTKRMSFSDEEVDHMSSESLSLACVCALKTMLISTRTRL